MILTILLDEAINNIEILKQYYNAQLNVIENKVKLEGERYKYSLALEKYLFKRAIEAKDIDFGDGGFDLADEEQELVDEILDTFEINDKDDGVAVSYKLKDVKWLEGEYEIIPNKGLKEYRNLCQQPDILGNTTLMMLLIKYEEAIMGIFKFLLSKYPKAYLNAKTVTYSELVELDLNIKEVKEYFIGNEVDSIMRIPLSEWYKMFQTKHKSKFIFDDNEFEEFKEIYYRRNILVHNNGMVNKIYLDNVHDSVKKGVKLGDHLQANSEYIKRAIDMTQLIIYATFWGLRNVSDSKITLGNKLFDIAFMHMTEENWVLSKYVYKNLYEEEGQSDSSMLCNRVNYWISIKNLKEFDQIKDEVMKFDVSAKSAQFKVAKYALLDDNEKVSEYLDKVIEHEIQADNIESWPLFIQYRSSPEYVDFKVKHKGLFEIHEYNPELDVENCEIIDEDDINNMEEI